MDTTRGYEFFDHTADIGIRARGSTLAELFQSFAQGLVELIVEESPLELREDQEVQLAASDVDSLLVAWLSELLYWFATDGFLPAAYELEDVTETSLRARVRGDRFDPARHVQGREVKAITRHLLQVTRTGDGWEGQVIIDI